MTISERLKKVIGDKKILTDREYLICYSYDATNLKVLPDAVTIPETIDDAVRILSFAEDEKIPVIPRGAGSGMSGGSIPVAGGIVLSTERLNKILEIDRENMIAIVEPGVINGILQREVELQGMFYPPDPASLDFCTIGGNIAENAGGPRALKYGVTRNYVLGLEVVLPGGKIINTGVRTLKGVVGYDLTGLMVGSEGTLGVITKAILRLLPLPEVVRTLSVSFEKMEGAINAISKIISSRIIPRTFEFMDRPSIRAVRGYLSNQMQDARWQMADASCKMQDIDAMLLIEVDGSVSSVTPDLERIAEICSDCGASDIKVAKDEDDCERLWKERRAISPALYRISPTKINEDIVVPRSHLAEMLRTLEKIGKDYRVNIVNFGHAGDGNIHVNIMTDKRVTDEYERAQMAVAEIFKEVLRLGGTISGEHGIGLTKRKYIGMEIGNVELELMRKIKKDFDPQNILNPHKIFPPETTGLEK
ncbi:MAG: FAD-linked oxidase C-terminal domain-containing protein [Nitrospirota bacterium]